MGLLSLITGFICIVITLRIYIPEIKKADTVQEKWMEFFDFITDPFTGSVLFYLGLLLTLYGLLSISNSL
ncbi:hypothetical protein AEA09_08095 [Lysinibacillus contaminans]|uniref:Uncharacterized protein n=1 Tax=Lysinibacillus contaminans TaxID=1293441 RepID=A0ABR5K1B4_9BACI|nr:hypothetical protein AEA09_08095 [Lysinibacillus contaminans]